MLQHNDASERLSRGTLFGVRSSPPTETGPQRVTDANHGAGDSLGPLTFRGLSPHPAAAVRPLRDALGPRDARLTIRDVGATAVGPTGPKDGAQRARSPLGLSPAERGPVTPDAAPRRGKQRRPAPEIAGAPAPWDPAPCSQLHTGIASGTDPERARRMAIRAKLRGFSSNKRSQSCGRFAISAAAGVTLARVPDGGAFYRGTTTCGLVHTCPCCAPKIQRGRALELAAAVQRHHATGGSVLFGTLTIRHGIGDDLATHRRAIQRAYSKLWAGRGRLSASFDVLGHVRAFEVTDGANGWHPHLHVLVFLHGAVTPDDVQAFQRAAFSRWRDSLVKDGYAEPLAGLCPFELVQNETGVARYLAKTCAVGVGFELASSATKNASNGQRTSWQLLAAAADASNARTKEEIEMRRALQGRWRMFERAMKGARQLQWSRGLAKALGLAPATDEQLAAADPLPELPDGTETPDAAADAEPVNVITLNAITWRDIQRIDGLAAALLDAAERGGAVAVREALAFVGIRPPPELPPPPR